MVVAGCDGAALGDVVLLVLAGGRGDNPDAAPGGGGRGDIPTPFLSFAAPCAAAEAYFRVSPGCRVGRGAGFIVVVVVVVVCVAIECNVARAGKGDFSCVEGLRTPVPVTSTP